MNPTYVYEPFLYYDIEGPHIVLLIAQKLEIYLPEEGGRITLYYAFDSPVLVVTNEKNEALAALAHAEIYDHDVIKRIHAEIDRLQTAPAQSKWIDPLDDQLFTAKAQPLIIQKLQHDSIITLPRPTNATGN